MLFSPAALHIPDGFSTIAVSLIFWLATVIMVALSVTWARRGRISENCRPAVRVGMGRKVLRTRSGASGLGSHKSRWLGPPWRYKRMTLLARPKPGPRLAVGVGTALACC